MRRTTLLFFIIVIANTSLSWAEVSLPYVVKTEAAKNQQLLSSLNYQLKEFATFIHQEKSTGKGPTLGPVISEVGCSISIRKRKDVSLDVFFDGVMNLDGKAVLFKELSEEINGIEKVPSSNHNFYIAPGYLLDIETLSYISDEGGENHNIVLRVSGPSGVTVLKGVRHCGC